MSIIEKVKRHWVAATAYFVFSLFFIGACLVSMNTYGTIAQAQRDIVLENVVHDVEIISHGNLNISFSAQIVNPSKYTLHVSSFSWYSSLSNESNPSERVIPVGEEYVGPSKFIEIPAKSTLNLSYWSIVDDRDLLSKLFGFINYSSELGQNYTLETLPFIHEFSALMFMGDFDHEYVRERYLNSLVTVSLQYSSAEETT